MKSFIEIKNAMQEMERRMAEIEHQAGIIAHNVSVTDNEEVRKSIIDSCDEIRNAVTDMRGEKRRPSFAEQDMTVKLTTNNITTANYSGKELVVVRDGEIIYDSIFMLEEALRRAIESEADGLMYRWQFES